MNTIIHDITYACLNTAESPISGSICLESPDLRRFWGGVAPPGWLFPAGFLFLPLLYLIWLLDIGSLDLVGPVAISCIRFYHSAMVVVVFAVVVAVFVNVVVVVILGSGRSPHGPLPPCHHPNGENTKDWYWISEDDSDPNDKLQSWVIRKSFFWWKIQLSTVVTVKKIHCPWREKKLP